MSEPAKTDDAKSDANTLRPPLCRSIRAKGFYVFTEEPMPVEETQTAVWWCVKTMTSVGPDGDAVHRTFCDGTRACYECSSPATS